MRHSRPPAHEVVERVRVTAATDAIVASYAAEDARRFVGH